MQNSLGCVDGHGAHGHSQSVVCSTEQNRYITYFALCQAVYQSKNWVITTTATTSRTIPETRETFHTHTHTHTKRENWNKNKSDANKSHYIRQVYISFHDIIIAGKKGLARFSVVSRECLGRNEASKVQVEKQQQSQYSLPILAAETLFEIAK